MTGALYSLSRKEGWRRYVEDPARERPGLLQPGALKRLGVAAREEYDEARAAQRVPDIAHGARGRGYWRRARIKPPATGYCRNEIDETTLAARSSSPQ